MKMRMIYTKSKEGKIKRESAVRGGGGGGSRGTEIKREGFEIGGGAKRDVYNEERNNERVG